LGCLTFQHSPNLNSSLMMMGAESQLFSCPYLSGVCLSSLVLNWLMKKELKISQRQTEGSSFQLFITFWLKKYFRVLSHACRFYSLRLGRVLKYAPECFEVLRSATVPFFYPIRSDSPRVLYQNTVNSKRSDSIQLRSASEGGRVLRPPHIM